jgi:hypothetical protein
MNLNVGWGGLVYEITGFDSGEDLRGYSVHFCIPPLRLTDCRFSEVRF